MRPPSRVLSSHHSRSGAATPSRYTAPNESSKCSGSKRKDRDYENENEDEETNINVIVRCRGRNEREVKENSGVVLLTDGVKSNSLELSMGPNALSNKTYHFDKVFSSAADQSMIYDDVVAPILDEVIQLNLFDASLTIFRCSQATIVQFLRMDKLALAKHTQCLVTPTKHSKC